jgi:hypothetical protein
VLGELLFVGDEVAVVVAGLDRDPVDLAGEGRSVLVVGDDAGAGVLADVGGLVSGEADRDGVLEAAVGDLVAVGVEGDGGAFGQAAAVVGELGDRQGKTLYLEASRTAWLAVAYGGIDERRAMQAAGGLAVVVERVG